MSSRRQFLRTATVGAAAIAAAPALLGSTNARAQEMPSSLNQTTKTKGGKWRPPYRFGQGGGPLGGSTGLEMSDEAAHLTLENAWNSGMRYFDTSPWYGLGLSERRFGHLLHRKPREEYIISSKIGRILTAAPQPAETFWANPDSFDYTYDYSADATRRSIEDSLQRLGISSLDIAFVHDLSPDQPGMDNGKWLEYFDQAVKGAMPELSKMRDEGMIKAWGMGVNTLEPILKCNEQSDPDLHLAALQYSLMEHEEAITKLFPSCDQRGISVVVGAPLNNGFLAGADRYNYGPEIPAGFKRKRARMQAIAKSYGIDLRTAALQFSAGPETVSSVIPGARKPGQPEENIASMSVNIPADFWAELKSENLIAENVQI